MSRRRNPARILAAAVLLATLLLVFLFPSVAQAQSVAVSNLDQFNTSAALLLDEKSFAQSFTTGSNSDGYVLTDIQLDFAVGTSAPGDLVVDLRRASGGDPGTAANKIANLTVPGTLDAGVHAFSAPASTVLDADTTYFVYIQFGGSTADRPQLQRTTSDAEDSGGLSGWSIGDNRHQHDGSSWSTATSAIQIAIKGTPITFVPSDAPTSVLLGTTGQAKTHSTSLGYLRVFQEFKTGVHPGGYELHRIKVEGASNFGVFPSGITATVRKYAVWGPVVATLGSPSSWTRGMNEFTAPANTILSSRTNYAVHFSRSGDGDDRPTVRAGVNGNYCVDNHAPGFNCYVGPDNWNHALHPSRGIETPTQDPDHPPWGVGHDLLRFSIEGIPAGRSGQEPTAPRDLTTQPCERKYNELSWTAPSGSPDRYEIRASGVYSLLWDGNNVNTQVISTTATEYRHTVRGGGTYYTVRAINANGPGPWSAIQNGNVWEDGGGRSCGPANQQRSAPAAPGYLAAEASGAMQVDLFWTVPYGGPTGYQVQWSADGETGWTAVSPPHGKTSTHYSHTGRTGLTTYHYRVRAMYGDGAGPWSVTAAATTPDYGPWTEDLTRGRQPSELFADADDAGIRLCWFAPNAAADEVTGYRVLRRLPEAGGSFAPHGEDLGSEAAGSIGQCWTDSEVEEGVLYAYRVKAIRNYRELSRWSRSASARAIVTPDTGAPANTPATGLPAISGTAQVGRTLTADPSGITDANGLTNATFSYRWVADDADIAGATGATYTLTDSDEGKAVSVAVSFTDDAGNEEELTSAATDAVEPETKEAKANTPATGLPTITGIAQVGVKLTADLSGIADVDGVTNAVLAYQWQADGADIPGETLNCYTPDDADEGKTISVRVSFTDDAGNEETLTSAATDAVEARPNHPATGTLTITGTARVGELLTADVSSIKDDDGLDKTAFSYQWQADGTDLSGATGSSYTLAASDEGKAMSVTVSFTDYAGHEESFTSAATAAVVAAAEEDEEPMDRPHGLTVEASDGAVVLTWTAPVVDYKVSSYHVLRHRPEQGEAEPLVYVDQTPNDDTAYIDTEVEVGVLYLYRVKAIINFFGELGEASDAAEIRVPATAQEQTANNPGSPVVSKVELVSEAVHEGAPFCRNGWYVYTRPSGQYGIGDTIRVMVTFDQEVTVVGTPRLTVDVGSVQRQAEYLSASGPDVEFGYMVVSQDSDYDGVSIPANAVQLNGGTIKGSSGSAEHADLTHVSVEAGSAHRVDGFPPQIRSVQLVYSTGGNDGVYSEGEEMFVEAVFTEQVLVSRGPTVRLDFDSEDKVAPSICTGFFTGFSYIIKAGDHDGDGVAIPDGEVDLGGGSITDHAGNDLVPSYPAKAAQPDFIVQTSASQEAVDANNPATGQPAISGTAQVGETLMADTSGIADADGLSNAVFSYQWLADGSDISGASESAHRLTDADEGKAISVTVSFTDDTGNEESLTSAATDTVAAAPPPPLTASLENAPAYHDGSSAFTFELRFSEELRVSYKTLRDHAFTVNGGTVRNAGRLEQGSNKGWRIEVRPNVNGDVTIILPVTGDCDDTGAICTEDGRKLSGRLELTVSGPESQQPVQNSPATGAPTITGTARVGETLNSDTSGIADEDQMDNASFSYQWVSNDGNADTDIQDATASTHTLVDADEGRTIKVRVSFTDDAGNDETLTSTATVEVEARPNSPATGQPTINGTALEGETLMADTSGIADEDGLTNVSFGYQWISNDGVADSEIGGATGSTYTLDSSDVGKTIEVRVSFTDDRGHGEELTSAATATVEALEPDLAYVAVFAFAGAWGTYPGDTITLSSARVRNDGNGASPATTLRYYQSTDDTIEASDTEVSTEVVPELTASASFDGGVVEVTAPSSPGTYYYGVCVDAVAGESDTTNNCSSSGIRIEVLARNTAPTGLPSISGTAQVGQTLTVDTSGVSDADGLTNVAYSYQWQADGAEISGATGSTYTLAESDAGKAVSVTVSFTDDAGNAEELTSGPTAEVAARPNTPATGLPTISGTALVGETLTAETSAIADEDGLDNGVFAYQWQSEGVDISGSTGETYTLADADVGKVISVRVSFTDDAGNGETLTSEPTAEVAARPNSPATGQPAISGTALVGETLTADTSGIADDDGLSNVSFSYQWISNDGGADSEIGGATGSTYILASGDVGRTIKVWVSFTDDGGNEESLTSAATDAVDGAPSTPLTASLENTPSSHDGASVFTFELRFSEEFAVSYRTLRDHAFTATGGAVQKAQRLEKGSNIGWKITVRPDGNGDVTVVLPETTDCDDQGAICTEDGRMLSHRLELTVSGPGE